MFVGVGAGIGFVRDGRIGWAFVRRSWLRLVRQDGAMVFLGRETRKECKSATRGSRADGGVRPTLGRRCLCIFVRGIGGTGAEKTLAALLKTWHPANIIERGGRLP